MNEKGIIMPTQNIFCKKLLEKKDPVYIKIGDPGNINVGDKFFCLSVNPYVGILGSAEISDHIQCLESDEAWRIFKDRMVLDFEEYFKYTQGRRVSIFPMDNVRPMNLPLNLLSLMNCKTNPQGKKFVHDRMFRDLWAIADGKTGIVTSDGFQTGSVFFMISNANAVPVRMMNEIIYDDNFEKSVVDGVKKATFREGIRIPTEFFNLPVKLASGKDIGKVNVQKILIGSLENALKGPVGEEFFKNEGVFRTIGDLFEALKRFYKDINEKSLVTGIEHSKPINEE